MTDTTDAERARLDGVIQELHEQADQIAKAGHNGWGNTMIDAAAEIAALRAQLDAARVNALEESALICEALDAFNEDDPGGTCAKAIRAAIEVTPQPKESP